MALRSAPDARHGMEYVAHLPLVAENNPESLLGKDRRGLYVTCDDKRRYVKREYHKDGKLFVEVRQNDEMVWVYSLESDDDGDFTFWFERREIIVAGSREDVESGMEMWRAVDRLRSIAASILVGAVVGFAMCNGSEGSEQKEDHPTHEVGGNEDRDMDGMDDDDVFAN